MGRLNCSQSFHSSPIATVFWGHSGQARVSCTSPLAGYVQLGREVGRGSHACLGTREPHEHIPRSPRGEARTCQQLRAPGSRNTDHFPRGAEALGLAGQIF